MCPSDGRQRGGQTPAITFQRYIYVCDNCVTVLLGAMMDPFTFMMMKVFGEEVVTVRTTGSVDELEMPSRAPPQSLPLDDVAERRVAFQAFNKTYNLTLRPSPGLLSPDFGVVVRRGDNVTENRQRPIVSDDELSRCFYRGVDAAFDLCKGLVIM